MSKKKEGHLEYGMYPVIEALESGRPFDRIFLQRGGRAGSLADIRSKAREHRVPVLNVPRAKLDRITGKNHQGVIGFVSPIHFWDPTHLIPTLYEKGRTPFLFILDRISDVRNFGAICRSALECDMDGVIIPEKGSAQIGGDALKTSAGALWDLPVARTQDLTGILNFFKDSGIKVLAATETASIPLHQQDLSHPTAIVLGAEGEGIDPKLEKAADERFRIPTSQRLGSLNVSVSAGIIAYEGYKQRNF